MDRFALTYGVGGLFMLLYGVASTTFDNTVLGPVLTGVGAVMIVIAFIALIP